MKKERKRAEILTERTTFIRCKEVFYMVLNIRKELINKHLVQSWLYIYFIALKSSIE